MAALNTPPKPDASIWWFCISFSSKWVNRPIPLLKFTPGTSGAVVGGPIDFSVFFPTPHATHMSDLRHLSPLHEYQWVLTMWAFEIALVLFLGSPRLPKVPSQTSSLTSSGIDLPWKLRLKDDSEPLADPKRSSIFSIGSLLGVHSRDVFQKGSFLLWNALTMFPLWEPDTGLTRQRITPELNKLYNCMFSPWRWP